MLGYKLEDIYEMMQAIGTAYEIIDGTEEVEQGLSNAIEFFQGFLTEGYINA